MELRRRMLTRPLRSLVAAALALVMISLPAVGAQAADRTIDPDRTGTIVITQLEALGGGKPGTGLAEDTSDKIPVPGVEFTVTRVPGIDLTTNEGWVEAQELTAELAAELVEGLTPADSGVTDANGQLVFSGLPLGLYYVDPVSAPGGFTTGSPFLVTLPMTDPDSRGQWMYTVHVYPKNARADIQLEVRDQDAVKLGDLVRWQSFSSIPPHALTGYAVEQLLPEGLSLQGGAGGVAVGFNSSGVPELVAGVDYETTVLGQRIYVEFTAAGLKKLEAAIAGTEGRGNAVASGSEVAGSSRAGGPVRVAISYQTKVLKDGEFVVEARLYPSRAALESGSVHEGVTSATAATKWGPVEILVAQVGKPEVKIPGVCFQLYATKQDAKNRTNKIIIEGVDEWITDKNGMVHIDGLRFSNFVNGSIVKPGDPLFRTYYAVMTCVPDGWHGSAGELPLIVDSATVADLAFVELNRDGESGGGVTPPGTTPSGPGASTLPKTGATILGVLVVSAAALMLGAWLRRRREEEQEA